MAKPGMRRSNWSMAFLRALVNGWEYVSCSRAGFTPSLHATTSVLNTQVSDLGDSVHKSLTGHPPPVDVAAQTATQQRCLCIPRGPPLLSHTPNLALLTDLCEQATFSPPGQGLSCWKHEVQLIWDTPAGQLKCCTSTTK